MICYDIGVYHALR